MKGGGAAWNGIQELGATPMSDSIPGDFFTLQAQTALKREEIDVQESFSFDWSQASESLSLRDIRRAKRPFHRLSVGTA